MPPGSDGPCLPQRKGTLRPTDTQWETPRPQGQEDCDQPGGAVPDLGEGREAAGRAVRGTREPERVCVKGGPCQVGI